MNRFSHEPALLKEVLTAFDYLKDKGNAIFVDGTLGLAGHSTAIAQEILNDDCHSGLARPERGRRNPESTIVDSRLRGNDADKIKVIGIDKDEAALDAAKSQITNRLSTPLEAGKSQTKANFIFVHDDFHNIDEILNDLNIAKVDGMLLDLGVSSMQLDDKERGFSFEDPTAPLDMRMNPSQITSAKDILNNYSVSELEEMLKRGEEKYFKNIAAKIARARVEKPFQTVGDLVAVLKISVPKKYSGKNFATDTFRALRIEVNDELVPLANSIEDIVPRLNSGSRLAIITFHSLEDRIVKQTFRRLANPCVCPPEFPFCTCGKKPTIKIISKKPILPSEEEISNNPRARSAKLRTIEKI